MTLKVIDIASHQSIEAAADPNAAGVIIKATQGNYYVNPKCNAQYALAKKSGKLLGLYHYAGGGNPEVEAQYFIRNIKNYVGEATLWLDWESGENPSWGDTGWCLRFVNEVYKITGVYPGIYIQASSVWQAASCADKSALWIAGYPTRGAGWDVPAFIYNTAPWKTYTIWQFTDGGGLDKNIANLDAAGWKALAKGSKQDVKPTPTPTPSPAPSKYSTAGKNLEAMAGDVQAGKVGDGDTRKNNLGKFYTGVQAIVNHRVTGKDATDVLVGETKKGVYGNGDRRKNLLGNYYKSVQAKIDGATPAAATRSYTVQNGDTLSGIGSKLGISYLTLAAKNGIKAPYTIFPGQKIKY